MQFEEMYEQRRTEQNKVADKFEKQMKAAKKSGNRANQEKVSLQIRASQTHHCDLPRANHGHLLGA